MPRADAPCEGVPPELLDRGARLLFESGRPIAQEARDLGVPSETLPKYIRHRKEVYGLRQANEIFKAAACFRDRARPRPDKVSAFIDEHRAHFGVEPICQTFGHIGVRLLAPRQRQRSCRLVEDDQLPALIEQVAERNYGAYGYRKSWLALRRAGHEAGRDRVKRLMRAHRLQGASE